MLRVETNIQHFPQIAALDGVLEVRAAHVWSVSPGDVVATLHVRVQSQVDETHVLSWVHQSLGRVVTRLSVQVFLQLFFFISVFFLEIMCVFLLLLHLQLEKDAPVDWWLARK